MPSKPETWSEIMDRTAQGIADLAPNPGWIDYLRDRVKRQEAEHGGHWKGLGALVRQKIAENKAKEASK